MKDRINIVLMGQKQNAVAAAIGVTPSAVWKWKKTGEIEKENAITLACYTGYEPAWLLTGSGPEKQQKTNEPSLQHGIRLISIEVATLVAKQLKGPLKAIWERMPVTDAGEYLANLVNGYTLEENKYGQGDQTESVPSQGGRTARKI